MQHGFVLREYRAGDEPGAYHVCLKTGDSGADGEPFYREDPDALARVYVGPYLAYCPDLALILEDATGICGYALAAADSRAYYQRYLREWQPDLCRRFPAPQGDPSRWSRVQQIHHLYHHPDVYCPEPYDVYPAHLHIDLLPRAQGRGLGRTMIGELLGRLQRRGVPGVHLGTSTRNPRAHQFYLRLGFQELLRTGDPADGTIYMGLRLPVPATAGAAHPAP